MTANRHKVTACLAMGSSHCISGLTTFCCPVQVLHHACKEAPTICETTFNIRNGNVIAPIGLLSPTLDVVD